jgi:hydroxymethylglutaryl-CoA lyase
MNMNTSVWTGARRRIYIQEVGPRDGLQMESAFVPTEDKIGLIDLLSAAGLAKIEATAFVSPQAIPSLRDAEIVLKGISRAPGIVYTCLVPNMRGAERAIDAGADELNLVMSASETHNLANLRMTRAQSFAALSAVIGLARQANVPVNVSLSCSFGCPMEGDIEPAVVLDWAARFVEAGARGITLCDTTGMAYPTQVAQMTRAFRARLPEAQLTLHFHNTRGMGLPTCWPRSMPAPTASTPPSAGSAVAPTPRARAATSAPRRSSMRSNSWTTTPAAACPCCCRRQPCCLP